MGGLSAVQVRETDEQREMALEAEWVAAAQAGDRQAFERLYRGHRDRVYALCFRLSGANPDLAQDLLQQAFVRAWRKLDRFRGDSRFGTWLHRLAVNVALSDRRIRMRRLSREQPMDEQAERTATGARDVSADLRRDLEQAIATLPERARTVLVLYDIEGYRHAEIAAMTGMAEGSSKAQLHRARKLVREALEQ